jgi:hypothetical protein
MGEKEEQRRKRWSERWEESVERMITGQRMEKETVVERNEINDEKRKS